MESKMAGQKLVIYNMVGSQKSGQSGGNFCFQDEKAREISRITWLCFHKKRYFRDKFPSSKKVDESSKNKEILAISRLDTATAWRCNRPKSLDTKTKKLKIPLKKRNKCGWWNSGGSSDDHNTKE